MAVSSDTKHPASNMTIIAIAIVIVVMLTLFAVLYFTPLLQYIIAVMIYTTAN